VADQGGPSHAPGLREELLQTRLAGSLPPPPPGATDEAQRLIISLPDAVGVATQVADVRLSLGMSGQSSGGFGPAALTTAELRVLQYLPTHLTVGEIAERLFLSRNTVKTHTITIYRKLGTTSRSGAVDIARTAGLID
jgi:LuxR family maltose regulon positive regulatory protein